MIFHDDDCTRCGATEDLIRISELGRALCPRCFPEFLRGRVEGTVRRFRMIPKRAHVAVAVSAGSDSACLLHILAATRARLNFGEARRLPADEKRAQWEAYQALSEQERERLAQDRPKPPVTAAPALRPTPPSPIARPVLPTTPPADGASRDIRSSVPLNRHTLLPLRTAPDPVDRR